MSRVVIISCSSCSTARRSIVWSVNDVGLRPIWYRTVGDKLLTEALRFGRCAACVSCFRCVGWKPGLTVDCCCCYCKDLSTHRGRPNIIRQSHQPNTYKRRRLRVWLSRMLTHRRIALLQTVHLRYIYAPTDARCRLICRWMQNYH